MRTKRASYNAISGLFYDVIAIAAGFILPRLILTRFGSEYNGVIASITQFIGYISLFTAGVGAVTQAALYKPLAELDAVKISGITRASEMFMRKVALIFAACLLGFAALYPLLVISEFEWFFVFSLVLTLGLGTLFQYFFGAASHMLVGADQREYIITLARICTTVLSTAVAAALIFAGSDIRVVMLASALITSANPVFIYWYAHRRYGLVRRIEPDTSAIKKRWDAFAQQVAGFVSNNVQIVVLTIFAGVREVSVHVVYYMVIRTIWAIVFSLTSRDSAAVLGNMLAKNDLEAVRRNLRLYEFLTSSMSALFYACTAVLIVPFVSVYTAGVYDVDYFRPLFAYLACAALFVYTLSLPYYALVQAAGHFKQTRNGAIVEASINVAASPILVQWFGMAGIEFCRLCATSFRSVQLAVYCSRHIIKRSFWVVARNFLLSLSNALVIIAISQFLVTSQFLPGISENTYVAWIIHAAMVFGIAVGVTALFAALFYRDELRMMIGKLRAAATK